MVKDSIKKDGFSNDLLKVIEYLENYVIKDFPTAKIDIHHYTYAFLTYEKCDAYNTLSNCITSYAISNLSTLMAQVLYGSSLKVINPKLKITYSPELKKLFEKSLEGIKESNEKLSTTHILLNILSNQNEISNTFIKSGITYDLVKSKLNTNKEDVPKQLVEVKKITTSSGLEIIRNTSNGITLLKAQPSIKKMENIETYFTNLNTLYKQGKIDEIIYRDNEVNMLINTLMKRTKNNAIISGEEGCGITSIVYLLASKITCGDITPYLLDKEIIRLEFSKLIAGCSYKGAFEQRTLDIIAELEKSYKKYIVFIDDINIGMSGNNKDEFINFLSGILSNDNIQIIATIPSREYKSCIESHGFIEKKFNKLHIEKLSINDTIDVLKINKKYYEEYHNVIINDNIIVKCVKLCDRYISNKCLPSSAIEVIDMMCASTKSKCETNEKVIQLKHLLMDYNGIIESSLQNEDYKTVDIYKTKNKKLLSELNELQNNELNSNNIIIATEDDLLNTISIITKIPLQSITKNDANSLKELPKLLKEHIKGQDEAIDKITKTIARNRLNLKNNIKKPDVFMLVGSSGCGKTFTAKKLSELLFGEDALIRVDCGNFTEKHSVTNLIGSPRSFVGYNDVPPLIRQVKDKPYSIILFDEIEKCATEIFNVLLTIFDEGYMEDNYGNKIDFSNAIIILSSNVGTKLSNDSNKLGFNVTTENNYQYKEDIIKKEIKNKFPPEFINRLNNIIFFNPLNENDLKNIVKLQLNIFNKTLNETKYKYSISYDDEVVNWIFKQLKNDDKNMGARPIIKLLETHIEMRLTDLLLDNEYDNEYNFNINIKEDKINIL
jgi:ATP-dependent Clp protease ATP-binding subunit ClpC